MNKGIPVGLIEATRLTRAGRLLEATALIQRILGHGAAGAEGADRQASDRDGGANDDAIDVEFAAVAEPAEHDLTPHRRLASNDLSQHFGLESVLRGRRDHDSIADTPSPHPTVVDGRPGQSVTAA